MVEDALKKSPLAVCCLFRIFPKSPNLVKSADPELMSSTTSCPSVLEPVLVKNSQLNVRVSNFVTSPKEADGLNGKA